MWRFSLNSTDIVVLEHMSRPSLSPLLFLIFASTPMMAVRISALLSQALPRLAFSDSLLVKISP
jgi:hypothetical protein